MVAIAQQPDSLRCLDMDAITGQCELQPDVAKAIALAASVVLDRL